jgi:hypothetical protein
MAGNECFAEVAVEEEEVVVVVVSAAEEEEVVVVVVVAVLPSGRVGRPTDPKLGPRRNSARPPDEPAGAS